MDTKKQEKETLFKKIFKTKKNEEISYVKEICHKLNI
jgi:hypothetical protein